MKTVYFRNLLKNAKDYVGFEVAYNGLAMFSAKY